MFLIYLPQFPFILRVIYLPLFYIFAPLFSLLTYSSTFYTFMPHNDLSEAVGDDTKRHNKWPANSSNFSLSWSFVSLGIDSQCVPVIFEFQLQKILFSKLISKEISILFSLAFVENCNFTDEKRIEGLIYTEYTAMSALCKNFIHYIVLYTAYRMI